MFCGSDRLSVSGCFCETAWLTGRLFGILFCMRRLWTWLECVAIRVASECKVATSSFLCFPSKLPTPRAVISPSSPASIQRTGAVRNNFSVSEPGTRVKHCLTWGSSNGNFPHSKSSLPPYFLGMSSISMKEVSVGKTSWLDRMKILEVVMGSNHFLIQPQTVGKKDGAPMIYERLLSALSEGYQSLIGYSQRFYPTSRDNAL